MIQPLPPKLRFILATIAYPSRSAHLNVRLRKQYCVYCSTCGLRPIGVCASASHFDPGSGYSKTLVEHTLREFFFFQYPKVGHLLVTTLKIIINNIDIEYCEQVEEMGTDSGIIQFKKLAAVSKALCMKHYGPYDRFYESFTEAYAYMEAHGYKVADHPRTCYIDGIWNQEDPEKWLSIIQIPIE